MLEIKTDIILGDCREALKTLPSDSVDLIFTSPLAPTNAKTPTAAHRSMSI
ncbi:MAG: hypothetical protein NZM06_07255 [Chloroherpetonaceae bacterium]|nr:hypothetical protein [Chloroherpetonaceae bacterium]MDW8437593.1 hypothetical protein [Chloroherpetonaceae bacterium]